MKKELTYYFCISVVLGGIIYTCEKLEIVLPNFIRFYVNDFLIIPIVLYCSLFVIQKAKGSYNQQLSFLNILYICFMYAVIFEYWLPTFHSRYTSDVIDVALYFSGGMLFYALQKRNRE